MAKRKQDVVSAVRQVQRWARSHALRLKGVSPDQRAGTLVHDIRNERLPALGLEIDRRGEIHVPAPKLKEANDNIDGAVEGLFFQGAIVRGRSVYSLGVLASGLDIMDYDDIADMAEGTYRDWARVAPGQAEAFLDGVRARHLDLFSREQGTVWIASLGGPGAGGEGGFESSPALPTTSIAHASLSSGSLRDQDKAEQGTTSGEDHVRRARRGGLDEVLLDERSVRGSTRTATQIEVEGTNDRWDVTSSLLGEANQGRGPPHSDPVGSRVRKVDGVNAPTSPSHDEGSSGTYIDSIQVAECFRSRENVGSADPDDLETPQTRWIANFSVRTSHGLVNHGRPCTIVTIHENGTEVDERAYGDVPPEYALVREIRILVERVLARSVRDIRVETDVWLPKHLVSRHKKFRSAALFNEVLRLHESVANARALVHLVGLG